MGSLHRSDHNLSQLEIQHDKKDTQDQQKEDRDHHIVLQFKLVRLFDRIRADQIVIFLF